MCDMMAVSVNLLGPDLSESAVLSNGFSSLVGRDLRLLHTGKGILRVDKLLQPLAYLKIENKTTLNN